MDRHAGLKGYCTGLMLPLSRKSFEPMAARVDPLHASARHQSLHHFVAKAEGHPDRRDAATVSQWVVPKMDMSGGGFGSRRYGLSGKKGKHSVGVARHTGCRAASRTTARSRSASSWRPSRPACRCSLSVVSSSKSGRRIRATSEDGSSRRHWANSLLQKRDRLQATGTAGRGRPKYKACRPTPATGRPAFRHGFTELGLPYVVGIKSSVVVWPPGIEPCHRNPTAALGRPPVVPRCRTPARQPVSVKDAACAANQCLPDHQLAPGTNRNARAAPGCRLASATAWGNIGKARLHPEHGC